MALEPLATPEQLAARLGVTLPDDDPALAQYEELLIDASAEMRSIIGQPLSKMTSTTELWPDRPGRYELPAWPVHEVSAVVVDGQPVGWYRTGPRTLCVPRQCGPVTVTFTHGWDPIPDDIVKWTCVLAASSLAAAESTESLGLTAGVSQRSEKIDDYQVSFQTPEAGGGDSAAGLTLPQRIIDRLRAAYGGGGVHWLEVQG
ncbi:hypothetical protein [Pseudonocardia sp. NPDC049154]|uniref:hypothetical protein n=1 Tax=Pseudonocardia sp. NPDC049154 TaxID=3155501 RepID=UPI0033F8DBB0